MQLQFENENDITQRKLISSRVTAVMTTSYSFTRRMTLLDITAMFVLNVTVIVWTLK